MRKRRFTRFAAALLAALALLYCAPAPAEESPLRGFSRDAGYVYAALGAWPQDADGGVRPILWRVLAVEDGRAFLLSEYILFARSLHTSLKEYREVLKGDFAGTELCAYLNGEFAERAFSEAELAALVPFEDFGRVFILSRDEMKNKDYGLGVTNQGTSNLKKIISDPGIRAWGTEWAVRNNGFPPEEYPDPKARVIGRAGAHISQAEMRLFVYSDRDGACSPYWTRTQSTKDARHANCVKGNGSIGHIEVGRDNEGVRPAVYLDLDAAAVRSGSGTMEDPYVLAAAGEETRDAAAGETGENVTEETGDSFDETTGEAAGETTGETAEETTGEGADE